MTGMRVRMYNVQFGDAVLVSIPERADRGKTIVRHILIDLGNVLAGEGGEDAVFEPVVRNVQDVLDGRPLDLYVMTHEHMDHVQGLFYASSRLSVSLDVDYAWLTASAEVDYYDKHPQAKEKRLRALEAYQAIERYLRAAAEIPPPMRSLMVNNKPQSTSDCVEYLRTLAKVKTTYVYGGLDLRGTHPFRDARLTLWAPEEDTSTYYAPLQPMALNTTPLTEPQDRPGLVEPLPPPGVDCGTFYDLVEARRLGYADNLLSIDKAANNTSVVLYLEWRGWKLLFPGDAELRSWKSIDRQGLLKPVHFLKVSHHGSHNGTPPLELLGKILPPTPADSRPRRAAVSTHEGTYFGVPDADTLAELQSRCELVRVGDAPEVGYEDVEFEP